MQAPEQSYFAAQVERVVTELLPIHAVGTSQGARPKILLVDDDGDELFQTRRSLEKRECEVVSATSVTEALRQIATQDFDVLITDLHMPEPGDGFTVITAMRHTQPEVLTIVCSDYPDVQKAMAAVLLRADEVLVKPYDVKQLSGLIGKGTSTSKTFPVAKESVASILDRDVAMLIKRWLARVEKVEELAAIGLSAKERTAYLPEIVRRLGMRLRTVRDIEAIDSRCAAAVLHGQLRFRQGYTAPLMVQESRLLQVCIFETIDRSLGTVDFTSVLPDVMIIADEVDSHLKQAIASFLTMQGEVMAARSATKAN
jgi:ActR/RegA family two-component response regulator